MKQIFILLAFLCLNFLVSCNNEETGPAESIYRFTYLDETYTDNTTITLRDGRFYLLEKISYTEGSQKGKILENLYEGNYTINDGILSMETREHFGKHYESSEKGCFHLVNEFTEEAAIGDVMEISIDELEIMKWYEDQEISFEVCN